MASSGRFGLPSAAAFCGVLVPLFYLFDASDSHRLLLRARCTEANFPRFVKRLVKSLMLLAPVASHSQLDCGIEFQLGMTRNRNSGRVRFCADHSSMMEANHGLHRHAAALAKAVFNLSGAVPRVRISDTMPDRGRRRALDIRLFRVR
jgi:hypothetical protein